MRYTLDTKARATQGVLGNTGTSSDGERRGVADGGLRVSWLSSGITDL